MNNEIKKYKPLRLTTFITEDTCDSCQSPIPAGEKLFIDKKWQIFCKKCR